jgi:hypothetical protein
MCLACELSFWMAMEDEPPVKATPKADDFVCEAPVEQAKPEGETKSRKKASAARE